MYDLLMGPAERAVLGKLRRGLLRKATGRVLEIGAGTGANLPHYPPGIRVVLLEPNPSHRNRGKRKHPGSTWVEGQGEDLPFPDDSFDTVVATFVLCSVEDPRQTISEIRRVLRSSGRFLFLEHIRSETRWEQRIQDLASPLWQLLTGCRCNRPTLAFLKRGGFYLEEKQILHLAIPPLNPQVVGTAVTSVYDTPQDRS
jgi:ubiquinone/menaquinone biosynthesis C-methylase UbiE